MPDLFLIILAFVWLSLASFSDIKKREVPNWLSFSLIVFSLAYVFLFSILTSDAVYLFNHILGLAIFIGLAYLFYYSRIFAGGDAKLIMGLGIVLSLSSSISSNILNYLAFILLMLLSGSFYGLFYSLVLTLANKKAFAKEFTKQFSKNKKQLYIFLIIGFLFVVPAFFFPLLFILSVLAIFLPILFIYAKSVEEACMISLVSYKNITVGDWLYKPVKLNRRTIKPYWEGLSEEQISLIKKHRKSVLIKSGIPFVPAIFLAYFLFFVLRYSSWSLFNLFA